MYRYTSNRAAENQALFGNNSLAQDDAVNGWLNNTEGHLVEITGDGLLDIVSISTGGGHIYEGLENGRFSAIADAGDFRMGAVNPDGPVKLIVFDADTDGELGHVDLWRLSRY